MGKWVEVRLQPDQYDLQDAILEHFQDVRHPTPRDMEPGMRLSVPLKEDTAGFLDGLGVQWKEMSRPVGRPVEYQAERKPIMINWPVELIDAIDERVSNRTKWLIQAAEEKFKRDFGEI